jgi:asparagine synthase (glutamine-hydrolysing)
MCGVTGFWRPAGFGADDARALALRMAARIVHRGPDDCGAWVDGETGIALGHRRLSIVDLSAAGHQPMASASGRYVIAFNGEIYNHTALRARLDAEAGRTLQWRGHSDTETLLAAFEAWGVRTALQASIGMFAIALWDRRDRCLILARDRLGEKPLYYGWQGSGASRTLLFGSELKALREHPAFASHGGDAVSREALTLFVRHGYVPSPYSIHRGIRKLPPGTLATLCADAEPDVQPYWSAVEVMLQGQAAPLPIDASEAVDRLESLLRDAVRQQMVADVPLGAFLSGGIDSSTVVALMQSQSSRPVRTFSIGFHEKGYDEAKHAKAVASHLGTDHTELYVTPAEALEVVPQLPQMYDEPFADSSQIPTHLVAQLARRHVTVALSGDAGDELFCGYTRYLLTQRLWGRITAVPRPLRHAAAAAIRSVPQAGWDRLGGVARVNRLGEKLHKGARAMCGRNADALYVHTVSQWSNPSALVPGVREPLSMLTGADSPLAGLPDVPRMMGYDLLTYLPDDILVKVDRAAMAVSLETRVPLLDHRVVEFAWQLPLHLKLRGGTSKWALREVLYRHVPRALIDRPKMGFGVPIGSWLHGPLRDWAETLLTTNALARDGLLDARPIRAAWSAHLSGRIDNQYPLWTVLMFQAWRREQGALA